MTGRPETPLTRAEREWRIERLISIGGGGPRYGRLAGDELLRRQRMRITLPALSILTPPPTRKERKVKR